MDSGFCSRSRLLFASLVVFSCFAFLVAASSAQVPSLGNRQVPPQGTTPGELISDLLDETREPPLAEVVITGPDFVVEIHSGSIVGALSILVPASHKESVARKRDVLEAVLRKEIATSALWFGGSCSETPWHLQGDHSRLSTGVGLIAARVVTRFNEALEEKLVWGFKCDVWRAEVRPVDGWRRSPFEPATQDQD